MYMCACVSGYQRWTPFSILSWAQSLFMRSFLSSLTPKHTTVGKNETVVREVSLYNFRLGLLWLTQSYFSSLVHFPIHLLDTFTLSPSILPCISAKEKGTKSSSISSMFSSFSSSTLGYGKI